jgi:presenilin-like A22 family membrane protease
LDQVRHIVFLFVLAQALGLFVGLALVQASIAYPSVGEISVSPAGDSSSPLNAVFFILYVVAGAALMVLVLKYYKGAMLFRLFEAGMLFVSSGIVFAVALAWFGVPYALPLAGGAAAAVTVAKFFNPGLKNAAAILASAGVGAIFGFSLDFLPAVLFVLLLSVYDFVSVFWTRHMVYMARELSGRNLSFSISSSSRPAGAGRARGRGANEVSTLELGTGDMVIPLLLAVSAYKISFSPLDALSVSFGALTGLLVVLWYVTSRKTFLPALPPITFCALLFLGVARLITALI